MRYFFMLLLVGWRNGSTYTISEGEEEGVVTIVFAVVDLVVGGGHDTFA